MKLFHKKKKDDIDEDDLLKELEEDMPEPKKSKSIPPAPKPKKAVAPAPKKIKATPKAPKPTKKPEIKLEKPALSKEQVAKLPLFMRVSEYDKIVKELQNITESLNNMEDILNKMIKLGEEEDDITKRWKDQLELTTEQVRRVVSEMPETGKLREILDLKKKKENNEKLKKEIQALKKDISIVKKAPAKKKPDVSIRLSNEIKGLKSGITGLKDEMKHLHAEFKMLNTLTQLKSAATVKEVKQETAKKVEKPEYKKSKIDNPWK